jgi:HEAT repeat protein
VEALGELEGLGTAPPALLEASRDTVAEVRTAAAEALRGFARDEAAARRLTAMVKDEDRTVRRAAAQSLVHLETPEARAALRAALGDADSEVRRAAARGLGRD